MTIQVRWRLKRIFVVGGEPMKRAFLFLMILFLCAGCGLFGWEPENIPYEPNTPAPGPHKGIYVSEHGIMEFGGDGEHLTYDFDEELAGLVGLPAGKKEGTYVFLSGDLPPHGSMPVRYDTAHELQIVVGEQSAVIDLGLASEDGKTASSGVGTVTSTRIPMLFRNGGLFSVVFRKEIRNSVESFFFSESNGSDYDRWAVYELKREEGVYTVTAKPEGVKEENALITEVDDDFVARLETILIDHDIESWNGYNESADVMDGIGFVLRVILTDETKLEASGYMEWPKGYNPFAGEIYKLFGDIYEENQ